MLLSVIEVRLAPVAVVSWSAMVPAIRLSWVNAASKLAKVVFLFVAVAVMSQKGTKSPETMVAATKLFMFKSIVSSLRVIPEPPAKLVSAEISIPLNERNQFYVYKYEIEKSYL